MRLGDRGALFILLLGVLGCGSGEGNGEASTAPAPAPAVGAPDAAAAGEAPFVDATAESGLDFTHRNGMRGERWFVEIMGAGAALLDFDDDGDLDLFLVQGGSLDDAARAKEPGDRLYRNDLISAADAGESTSGASRRARFVDVTAQSGIVESGYGMGVATADYDADGRVDLYVTNWGPNELWRNLGGGRFERRGAVAGVDDRRWSVPAVFFDADADGRLDLYVGNYVDYSAATHQRCLSALGVVDYCGPLSFGAQADVLYRNRGDGTFADASGASGLASAPPRPALGAVAGDFDADGTLDLYVANDQTANYLWRGQGGGRLVEDGLAAGCALDGEGLPQASMGVTAGDADGDGDEDFFLSHLTEEHHTLYLNDGRGSFEDATTRAGLVTPTWALTGFGVGWLDFDGDGLLDLLAISGAVKLIPDQVTAGDPLPLEQPAVLLRNQGGIRFEPVEPSPASPLRVAVVGRGAAFGDVDNDGDTDVVVTANDGQARLLRNEVGNRSPWIGLRVVEPLPAGGARDALDARVGIRRGDGKTLWRWVRTGGSYASASDPRLLFGLGSVDSVAAVEVHWPGGEVETWGGLEPGRYHTLRRGEGE